jgi:hypothetical protein
LEVPKTRPPSYDLVLALHLFIGVGGALFVIGSLLDSLGWLNPILEFAFGDRAETLLYDVSIIVSMLGGFYLFLGWIPAIAIVIVYRKWWPIWAPSAFFLLISAILIATLESDWMMESSFEWTIGTLLGIYVLACLIIGVKMIMDRGKLQSPPPTL